MCALGVHAQRAGVPTMDGASEIERNDGRARAARAALGWQARRRWGQHDARASARRWQCIHFDNWKSYN
jgi:hypothetical protein